MRRKPLAPPPSRRRWRLPLGERAGADAAPSSCAASSPGRRARARRASAGASVAWNRYSASLGPLDLAASRDGSTIVVDRDGRLLRAFTMPDGRWRLPVTTHEVDPRYLAMLIAYEDGRFYEHDGVDLRALVRAGRAMADARPRRLRRLDA